MGRALLHGQSAEGRRDRHLRAGLIVTPTLVTCIYDLAKRGHASHRSVDWMFAHSAYVIEMPQQLVVFCDPEFADEVKKRRGDRPTVIFNVPLENLPSHAQRGAIEGATLQVNASKTKVTPTYVELMW